MEVDVLVSDTLFEIVLNMSAVDCLPEKHRASILTRDELIKKRQELFEREKEKDEINSGTYPLREQPIKIIIPSSY